MAVPLTARVPVDFTPPSIPKRLQGADPADPSKHKFRIVVRVPTMMERDSYGSALVRAGAVSYTPDMLKELTRAGVMTLYPEDEHETKLALLEEIWTVTEAERRAAYEQAVALRELTEKAKAAGKTEIDEEERKRVLADLAPDIQMDKSRRIEAAALNQHVMTTYDPVVQALAKLSDQDAKRAWHNAEIYVKGWVGLEFDPDGNGRGGLMHNEVEYLRGKIGSEAFQELSDFITALQTINEDEEKNLASLLENRSAPIGSKQEESPASSDNGNSTGGPSTPTPDVGSQKTTGSSSSSTTSSATKSAKSRGRGRTGKRSSTSRSS